MAERSTAFVSGPGRSPNDVLVVLARLGDEAEESETEGSGVTVKYFGSDHLSYRGDAEEFSDACRTVLLPSSPGLDWRLTGSTASGSRH